MASVKKVARRVINDVVDNNIRNVVYINETLKYAKQIAEQANEKHKLEKYKPLTKEQFSTFVELMPDMIQITDWDKRQDDDVCKDAVAFNDGNRRIHACTILTKNTGLLNATFYPCMEEGVFYRDPVNPNYYINLNDYFDFLKKAKVHELNQIAQDLGATHIKISLKSEKKVFAEKSLNVGKNQSKNQGKSKKQSKGSGLSVDHSNMQFDKIEVASEKEFKGHEAQLPELNYFKYEPDILTLIDSRLDKNNPIKKDKAVFKYSSSSGIKKIDALNIEGVLKKLKIGGNASFSKEVEDEENIYFEYEIDYPDE